MRKVGAYEAKVHLSRLLDAVSDGEEITITRHGVPVAHLVPVRDRPRRNVEEAVARMRQARKGRTLDGLSVREMIEEGRRF